MKGIRSFTILSLMLTFYSCGDSAEDGIYHSTGNNSTIDSVLLFGGLTSIVDSVMNEYSIGRVDTCVYLIYFSEQQDTCFFEIIASNFASEKNVVGTNNYRGHTVALYFIGDCNRCWEGYVDTSNFSQPIPNEAKIESQSSNPTYEPYKWRYMILERENRICFVDKGYF